MPPQEHLAEADKLIEEAAGLPQEHDTHDTPDAAEALPCPDCGARQTEIDPSTGEWLCPVYEEWGACGDNA